MFTQIHVLSTIMTVLTMEHNSHVDMLISRWQIPLLLFMLLTSCSAQSTYYVTPTPDTPCPGEPCHTLSEYVAGQFFNNLPVNITMEFLPGNHTLEQTISVTNLTWLTLHGDSSSLPEVTSRIECTWPAWFVFRDITELYITALAYTSCGHHSSAAVHILSIQQSTVSYCSFHNSVNADSYEHNGGALYIHNSTVILTKNKFQHNTAKVGGALTVENSTLTLTMNTFHNNSAVYYGGAIYMNTSKSIITKNIFEYNTAVEDGGALAVLYGVLSLTGNTFQNNSATNGGGVLTVGESILNLTRNTFQNNCADYGGALDVLYSTLSLTENTFQYNSADDYGGALYVDENSTLNLIGSTLQYNSADHGGALYVDGNSTLNLIGNTLQYNSADHGGALYVDGNSTLNLIGSTLQYNSADNGGALNVDGNSTLNLIGNTLQYNSADVFGGALCAWESTLSLTENTFQYNSADDCGGAFYAWESTLNLTENTFQYNSADVCGGALFVGGNRTINLIGNTLQYNSADVYGGALYVWESTLSLTWNIFKSNSAVRAAVDVEEDSILSLTGKIIQNNSADFGGALFVYKSILNLTGNTFQNNSADFGGALYVDKGTLNLTENIFQNNSAESGGALDVYLGSTLSLIGNTFQNNSAILGGSLYMNASSTTFTDDYFTDSSAKTGGALFVNGNSIVKMYNITLGNSRAEYGGGMVALNSQLEVLENTFENNTASYGGGLYVHNTEFTGSAIFTKNSVTDGGGGIYASGSTLFLKDNTTIIANNSAMDGGGLLLSGDSKLLFQPGVAVHFIGNSASSTGGAIKVKESNPLTYCIPSITEIADMSNSDCFFQIKHEQYQIFYFLDFLDMINSLNINRTMRFNNNSAVEAGSDLYGGSVDCCKLSNIKYTAKLSYLVERCISGLLFDVITSNKNKPAISSDPLHICTCGDGLANCTGSYHPEPVYPGGTLEVPVIAFGQRYASTTAVIQVTDTTNMRFSSLEYSQRIENSCNTLNYTINSRAVGTTQEMTLYAQGPCSPTNTNTLKVAVIIQSCPPGFQLSMNKPICICAERLQQFTNTCLVDSTTVLREHNAEFWVGYDSDNKSRGLILHQNCPFDYCTSEETYLAVDDSDKQCNHNRSGLLCGRCSENLSLALGSSRCLQCSNSYLSFLAAFAIAGIALVLFLLVLRLTVAAGTINGLVLYANIVAVNPAIFFQPQITNVPTGLMANVLSVFIAWLNLDLGIETCFYNGMDAYVKMWMQFAFPVYVWALVGMIIVGSYYSGRVASIFGRNPIAVLATLFLLSYAKLLRTVIAALSYTSLEYPNNSQIAVWLYDGNIRYLSGKHIPLFTAAMVCLIFLFLPYTMLLIFSQCLQAKSHLKIFSLINSRYVKPFLDAYHAPYTNKHRYWTGLMLLLRFFLFLISAVNALGDPSVNLLAIASITTAILPTILAGTRIYKTWSLGLLETSFIINLTILAVASLYIRLTRGNQNAVTFTSVGIAFATFTGIVIYHSVQQIKGTRLWRRVWLRQENMRVPLTDVDSGPQDTPYTELAFMPRPAPTQTVVDIREFHELREPCMATD